jgi:DivIVA domain-containing protein
MAEYNYTTQEILQQQFKTKMRGYDPEEVDEYLDNVIRDYETMQKEILSLKEENEMLVAKIEKLQKNAQLLTRPSTVPASDGGTKGAGVTNFDILKRLSNLEREVFGSKLDKANEAANRTERPSVPRATTTRQTYVEQAPDPDATRLF